MSQRPRSVAWDLILFEAFSQRGSNLNE